jgi:hypothetical protein
MRAVRASFVVALLFAVATAMLYSQICATDCALYGCSEFRQARPARQPEPSSHCKQHDARPEPQEQGHSKHSRESGDCAIHSNSLALLLPAASSVVSPRHGADPAISSLAFITSYSPAPYGDAAEGGPLRSPPARTHLTVLRI